MRLTRVNLPVLLVGLGMLSCVLCVPAARADEATAGGGASASASGDGGGEITASVSVEYVTAGSGGDGGVSRPRHLSRSL